MRSLALLLAVGCGASPKPTSPPPAPDAQAPPVQAPAPAVVDATDQPGDETALSARRWVYASYFTRFKKRVYAQWDPQTVWRRLAAPPPGTATRETTVSVELAPATGELVRAVVVKPSGVAELDLEALRALRAASPYGEPPAALVKDGGVKFQFAFYFEIGAQQGTVNRVPAP